MKRRKTRIRKLTDVPGKLVKHLHPTFRSIVERNSRRFKVRRAHWLKIRNRVLYYRPKARVFPWYCDVCTLSSRFLSVIQEHSCPNKNLSRHVQDFTNEQRIALMGFRSKAKDALAVMERVPNPQAIDIGRVRFPFEGGGMVGESTASVPRLSEICLASLKRASPKIRQRTAAIVRHPFNTKNGTYRYRHPKRTGQLCTVCQRLFPVFTDYEEHLMDGKCGSEQPPDPVPIHMSDSGNVPPNYLFSPKSKSTAKPRVMICSLCHDDRFPTVKHFHEHIIDCARKLAACSIGQ
ncbi:hypothetical protein Q1695_011660 [Nippostrongylus brasiliensis]|nr:hypothetical protein Q1695_011660 [Nippostrongylus brasiliensis]